MKRLFVFMLLMCVVISFIGCGTDNNSTYSENSTIENHSEEKTQLENFDEISDWQKAYIEFLEDKNNEYISFALVYIDDDNIPELYMCANNEATGDSVTSYKNGAVFTEDLNRTGGGRYIQKSGKVLNENGNMGNCYTHAYNLTDDGFVLYFTAHKAEIITEFVDDEYEIIYEFSVEDTPVTEQKYNDALNVAFDYDNSKRLDENAVSYDQIIDLISNFY